MLKQARHKAFSQTSANLTFICRRARYGDLPVIRGFARNALELFFFMPKAQFPLCLSCLKEAVDQRVAPTVVLYDGVIAGLAELYDCDPGTLCCIGNVIGSPHSRGRSVATRLIQVMIDIAVDAYHA